MDFIIESDIEMPKEEVTTFEEFYNSMKNQKYRKHYERLINRAKERVIEGYSEKHHIIPKCLGGTNDKENYARLSASEHYVAHQLLCKAFPKVRKLSYAAKMMTIHDKDGRGNNKLYSWIRKRVVDAVKNMPKEQRAKLALAATGRKKTPEEIEKVRLANTGRKNTLEMRERQSKILKNYIEKQRQSGKSLATGRSPSKENLFKLKEGRDAWYAKFKNGEVSISEETRNKMSIAGKGRKQTKEHIDKRMAGKNRIDHNKPKLKNYEVIEIMAQKKRGTKQSPEHIAKRMAAIKATKDHKKREKALLAGTL